MMNADRRGKVMSAVVTTPFVASTIIVRKNDQLAPAAHEPNTPPDVFVAVPETTKSLMLSICATPAGTSVISAAVLACAKRLKDKRNFPASYICSVIYLNDGYPCATGVRLST